MLSIIPAPQSLVPHAGSFTISATTRIVAQAGSERTAAQLAALLEPAVGTSLLRAADDATEPNVISLSLDETRQRSESYSLLISEDRITLTGADEAGLFYGVQTLRQMLPAELESGQAVEATAMTLPGVTIDDYPAFSWRGLHLDVGRHLFSLDFLKKHLDIMALHKYNVFHWHLTEDQGWRIEIKRYPRLTEVGAWRPSSPIPANRDQQDGVPYGGFYRQDEIRELVAYAADRFITVVPEIEMPGHAAAALASYPEYGCLGSGYQVRTTWGIDEDVFCAGNDETFTFIENVLAELVTLFPGEFIHVGGDECPKVRWRSCPRCQARIAAEGLADEEALQSYFMRRVARYLEAHGRRLIGWDELLEGGLPPNASIMSWRGIEQGITAASAGHDVVMSPTSHCYLDYYQSEDQASEPPAISGFIPLELTYHFNPHDGVPVADQQHILGGQGNIWTEYMPSGRQVEYMVYPRALALTEALWTQDSDRDYSDFCRRLEAHLPRLDILNVNYRPLDQ